MIDYIQTIGNFQSSYIQTGFYASGYYDMWNLNADTIIGDSATLAEVRANRKPIVDDIYAQGATVPYEFLFRPPAGILNSIKPLPPKFEFLISFDRAPSDLGLINAIQSHDEPESGKALELKNVYLKARYYSSPYLRNYFATIEDNDICYNYDECVVYHKNLPQDETNIRLANVIGGNTPKYLFAGIISAKALNGDCSLSSTCFKRNGVKEFDLTLNGYSCNGFPLTSDNGSPLMCYEKYLQTTGRKYQTIMSDMLGPWDFKSFHYLYSHKFEGESSESGWIGINLKLEAPLADNYVLGIIIIITIIPIF